MQKDRSMDKKNLVNASEQKIFAIPFVVLRKKQFMVTEKVSKTTVRYVFPKNEHEPRKAN